MALNVPKFNVTKIAGDGHEREMVGSPDIEV